MHIVLAIAILLNLTIPWSLQFVLQLQAPSESMHIRGVYEYLNISTIQLRNSIRYFYGFYTVTYLLYMPFESTVAFK